MINVQWDEHSWAQLAKFEAFAGDWHEHMHLSLAHRLAKASIDYMKPLLHVRTNVPITGALEDSLHEEIVESGNGFDIYFLALFYGLYIDEGNDNLGEALASTYGLHHFPADWRLGKQYAKPLTVIHPMGSFTPGVPNHYSEKTLEHLANEGVAMDIALEGMSAFLESVVIRV